MIVAVITLSLSPFLPKSFTSFHLHKHCRWYYNHFTNAETDSEREDVGTSHIADMSGQQPTLVCALNAVNVIKI
jgi:hypothetical protein